jgi:hypothetical protein
MVDARGPPEVEQMRCAGGRRMWRGLGRGSGSGGGGDFGAAAEVERIGREDGRGGGDWGAAADLKMWWEMRLT